MTDEEFQALQAESRRYNDKLNPLPKERFQVLKDHCKVCGQIVEVAGARDPWQVHNRILGAVSAHNERRHSRPGHVFDIHPHDFKSATGLFTQLLRLQLGFVIEFDQELEPGLTYVAEALCLSAEDSDGDVWVEMLGSAFGPTVQRFRIEEELGALIESPWLRPRLWRRGLRVTKAIDQHATIRRATRLNHEGLLPIDVVETVRAV